MNQESNKYSGLEHVPPCSNWPPPWLVESLQKAIAAPPARICGERLAPSTPAPSTLPETTPPVPATLNAAAIDRLNALVNRSRLMEYGGRFPGPLGRVTEIYLELAQAPDADLRGLEFAVEAALENW